MIMDGQNGKERIENPTIIVTLECAALLPGSGAQEVVDHVEEVWQRGKIAVDQLREQLGPELRDTLCQLRNGGVSLHKIYGVMHDTCNCANKVLTRTSQPIPNPNLTNNTFSLQVAKLMLELRERKCSAHFGE
jgi:hypothetical protein